jgi:hypothetical protein
MGHRIPGEHKKPGSRMTRSEQRGSYSGFLVFRLWRREVRRFWGFSLLSLGVIDWSGVGGGSQGLSYGGRVIAAIVAR